MDGDLNTYIGSGSFVVLVILWGRVELLNWRVKRLEGCMNGEPAHKTPYTKHRKERESGAKREKHTSPRAMRKADRADHQLIENEIRNDQKLNDTVNSIREESCSLQE